MECVRFDPMEEVVVAGSSAGALKIWDLEAVKIIKTFTGHKAGVRSVDFHPYGNNLVSGSLDTSIKVNLMNISSLIIKVLIFTICESYFNLYFFTALGYSL